MADKAQLNSWSSGLCECFSDCEVCCLTLFCPCVSFGRIAEIVDRGSTSCILHGALFYILGGFTHCGSVYSCTYRTKLRKLYGIEGSQTCDCIVSTFCPNMALCQEYREFKTRGFDMSAGWQGNVELKTAGAVAVMAPEVQGGMSR